MIGLINKESFETFMINIQTLQSSMTVDARHSLWFLRVIWLKALSVIVLSTLLGGLLLFIPVGQVHAATNAAAAYADSHWNCANISCSSTVSAGSAQPNFQCAEFVARALSTEGLVPGLNSSSSQSAYGSYKAANGKTYDLLWVGWTTADGYDTGINGLYQYLIDNNIASNIGNSPSSAGVGDVVIYHEGQGHTSLIVTAGSSPLIDAHNNARYHIGYTEGYSSLVILHISGSTGGGGTTPPSASWPNVGEGSTGENVRSIQLMLNAHGDSLSVDGDFGPDTKSAVESYQSAHGLDVDGVVGPQTWPALIIQTSNGSSGSAVEALQRQLNVNGESVTVDSDFGSLTEAAVRDFQTKHGLGVDGIAGPQTWESLVS